MVDAEQFRLRYDKALEQSKLWYSMLQRVYDLTMPDRGVFAYKHYMPGQRRNRKLYDDTAPNALTQWAAQTQLAMFGENWLKLTPGTDVTDPNSSIDPKLADDKCQEAEDTFMERFNQSNFQYAMFQSLMEVGISTGIILVSKGTWDNPLHFTSVPLHEVCLVPGPRDTINDVFRTYKVPAGVLEQTWPGIKLPDDLKRLSTANPVEDVELIEGTVYNHNAPKDKAYSYIVMRKDGNQVLHEEFMPMSPWIVIRSKVLNGEVVGRGIALDVQGSIQAINQMQKQELESNSWNASPIWMDYTGGSINPHTARVEPGAIIPIQPSVNGGLGIQQLKVDTQIRVEQFDANQLRQQINSAFNVNPLGNITDPGDKTATEINARQDHWYKINASSEARLIQAKEQIFHVCWNILHSFGYVKTPKVDGRKIKVEFSSLATKTQATDEINKLVQFSQYLNALGGPEVVQAGLSFGLDITEIPEWLAKKLDIDKTLLRGALGKEQYMNAAKKQLANQQAPTASQAPIQQPTEPLQPGLQTLGG